MERIATMDDPQLPDLPQSMILPDGKALDTRQIAAVTLMVETDMPVSEIAERSGYSDRSAASRFLNSEIGKNAVRAALLDRIDRAGMIGLTSLMRLAGKAKSELVQRQAAADLVNLAGLRIEQPKDGEPKGGRAPSAINIQINTGGPAPTVQDGDTLTVNTGPGEAAEIKTLPAEIEPDKDGRGGPGEK